LSTATEHSFWHPFAAMSAVKEHEFELVRGEGVWVFDSEGNRYLDGTASLWYSNVGHGNERIREAVNEQMGKLEAYSTFGDYTNPPAEELADRLASYSPMAGSKVFFTSGGGDSIDTAAKLARRYWHEQGHEERQHLIGRVHGYHGTHGFGTSLAGIPANRAQVGSLVEDVSIVAYDDPSALAAEIEKVGPERVAAFFLEPVIGAGGVYPPADGYIEQVASICKEHGVLLVVDAVINAFGRLGTWFGIERWPGVTPDMIAFAKGVTSGYLPLGGLVVSGEVAAPFWDDPKVGPFRHGATYAGHPTCCAAGLANLDVLEEDGLLERGRELEGKLFEQVTRAEGFDAIAEVRGGTGLMAAAQLNDEILKADPTAPIKLAAAIREHGVLARNLVAGVAVSPPLTIEDDQLELIGNALVEGVDQLWPT
jgi:putrescine aminotransferase